MIRYISLILFVLAFGMLNGCNDNYEHLYESSELRKARDELEMTKIRNEIELKDAEHQIDLIAAKHNIKFAHYKGSKKSAEDEESYDSDPGIIRYNYAAVACLLKKLRVKLPKDNPILVASFVNLDNLNESSTFGRAVSEQIASALEQKGYSTIEMKLRTSVFIKKGSGEFLLSREISEISVKHRAQAVVVGTYAIARDRVYLTARVVDVSNSRILSSADYEVPMTRNVFKMLLKGTEGTENIDWL